MHSSNRPLALPAVVLAFALTPLLATAQTAAPAAPAAATPVTVPTMDCPTPGDVPKPVAGMNTMEKFQRKVDDYKKCVNTYALSLRAQATDHAQTAKAYSDASNAAIEGYNAYVGKINDQAAKQNGG